MTWLSDHRRLTIFVALVVAQALFVLAIVVREEGRLDGLEIVLQSQPVDPRDPLRGDFVILRYVAEDVTGLPAPSAARLGESVFVEFEDRGRFWEPVTVNSRLLPREEWREGSAWVRARVDSVGPLRVRYEDLEAYFIPAGTGDPPEPPDVIVSVTDDGLTRIKRLEIDGIQWPDDTVPQDDVPVQPGPITPREAPSTPAIPPNNSVTPGP